MFFNFRVLSVVKLFLPDAEVKSRRASNEKVKSSSSVATQSVKRP